MTTLTAQQIKQLDDLVKFTIKPALGEDFDFTTPEQADKAIQYLKAALDSLDPTVFIVYEEEDDYYIVTQESEIKWGPGTEVQAHDKLKELKDNAIDDEVDGLHIVVLDIE